jgi:hypothetical protein
VPRQEYLRCRLLLPHICLVAREQTKGLGTEVGYLDFHILNVSFLGWENSLLKRFTRRRRYFFMDLINMFEFSAGSRSNSPSSKYSYATYSSPYAQHDNREGSHSQLPVVSPPGKGIRRFSNASSASSSRDTSPQGRLSSRLRSRSVSQSPQVVTSSNSNR